MKHFIKFKSTPIPRIISLNNGILTFQCTCGGLGYVPVRLFTKTTRCLKCMEAEKALQSSIDQVKEYNLFITLYDYILEDYTNAK